MMNKSLLTSLSLVLGAVLLSGCAKVSETFSRDREIVYTQSRPGAALEVPPDLTRPSSDGRMAIPGGTATWSQMAQEEQAREARRAAPTERRVLPAGDARIERDGAMRWVVYSGDSARLWQRLRDFWSQNGLELALDEPEIGLMETSWAENVAHLPRGRIGELLGKIHDSGHRDRYRIRLEDGAEPGTVEIHLSHQGLEENLILDQAGNISRVVWEWRPANPELEAEMRNRLVAFLNDGRPLASETATAAAQPARAHLVREGGRTLLQVDENFDRTWRRTGLALDRIGMLVEDRDRSAGLYYVRGMTAVESPTAEAEQRRGWFGRMLRRDRSEQRAQQPTAEVSAQQVRVTEVNGRSQVEILDADGRLDTSAAANELLEQLQRELK